MGGGNIVFFGACFVSKDAFASKSDRRTAAPTGYVSNSYFVIDNNPVGAGLPRAAFRR
jgi:hypothetical protein